MKLSILKKALVGVVFLTIPAVSAFGQSMFALGVNGLYGTEIKSFAVGAKVQFETTSHFRVEDAFNYFFKKNGVSIWEDNLNLHYLFYIGEKFRVYPLAGLTLVQVKYDMKSAIPAEYQQYAEMAGVGSGSSSSKTYFGGNVGAGIEYLITPHLGVGLEGKYSIVKDVDQAVFGLGVTYRF